MNLGEWCVRTGAATAEQVRECLRIQADHHARGETPPRLGEILVARGYVAPEQVAEALAEQGREIRSCPRCRVRVNVDRRSDALGYECARCHGRLEEPSDPGDLSATDQAVIVRSRDPLPPDVCEAARDPENLFGKYVLLREIGRGGIGQVFLAWDTFLCQRVALKRVRPDTEAMDDDETVHGRGTTLIREARHAIRLRHPAIVSIFDVGREGEDTYISMEYVEGRSADEAIRQAAAAGHPSLYHQDPAGTLRMLADVAHALHYAHTSPSPVVHCDLKPSNLMVDAGGRAHLLDFGLARRLGHGRKGELDISGTPNYMSPEQAAGWTWEIDARSDVYGLGAVLYEFLTGRPPFMGDPLAVLKRVATDVPVRPSTFLEKRAEIPPLLDDLCMRCLEKDKAKRPQTMLEVARALEEIALGPAPARKPRRVLASLVAAAAFALAAIPTSGSRSEGPRTANPGLEREETLLRARILERLARTPLAFEDLRLRERTLRDARIVSGDLRGLDVRLPSLAFRIDWSDLEPSQFLELARESGAGGDPDGLLALGVYSLRAGRRMDAKEYFEAARHAAR